MKINFLLTNHFFIGGESFSKHDTRSSNGIQYDIIIDLQIHFTVEYNGNTVSITDHSQWNTIQNCIDLRNHLWNRIQCHNGIQYNIALIFGSFTIEYNTKLY
jgi:hypothetical protein